MDETIDADVRNLPAMLLFDLGEVLDGYSLVSFSIGCDGAIYILAVTTTASYREVRETGASFANVHGELPHEFVVVRWLDGVTTHFEIRDQTWNYHFVQPLPGDELLLVAARSQCRNPEDFDKNGQVFTVSGNPIRAFLLGDGIAHVQTTADGTIWAGYTDEGIFGNFGWGVIVARGDAGLDVKRGTEPVGAGGFVAWDRFGRRVTDYQQITVSDAIRDRVMVPNDETPPRWPDGKPVIDHCYALNASLDDEIWVYTYSTFPLMRIRKQVMDGLWECPVHGARVFAVRNDNVLFGGGYREHGVYRLFILRDDGMMQHCMTYHITFDGEEDNVDEQAAHHSRILTASMFNPVSKWRGNGTYARDDSLYFRVGARFFRVCIEETLNFV